MRGFIIAFLLVSLCAIVSSHLQGAIKNLIAQKHRLSIAAVRTPILTAHGQGITDEQETTALNHVDQALQTYGEDIYANSIYIQKKIEESFGGIWNVEVFGNDLSWGRATHINNEQWILLFGYGQSEWDYIIWTPEC